MSPAEIVQSGGDSIELKACASRGGRGEQDEHVGVLLEVRGAFDQTRGQQPLDPPRYTLRRLRRLR